MKVLWFLVCMFGVIMVSGQSDHFSRKNALKISPVEFGRAEFQMSYERYFGDRTSSLVISPSIILKESSVESKEGFKIEGQYRFYLSHIREDQGDVFLGFHNIGIYTGVYASYMDYTEDYQYFGYDPDNQQSFMLDLTKTATAGEGGAIIGLQIDITSRILLDFFVGGGIRYSDVFDEQSTLDKDQFFNDPGVFDPEYQGVKPRIGFQLGIFF